MSLYEKNIASQEAREAQEAQEAGLDPGNAITANQHHPTTLPAMNTHTSPSNRSLLRAAFNDKSQIVGVLNGF
jgi:hypothetical protein